MSTVVTVAGINYTIPAFGDSPSTGWGTNLSSFFIAVAAQIAAAPGLIQITNVTTSPTTVVSGHTYLVDSTSIPISLQLPTPVINTYFIVKDKGFNAFTNNITILQAGTEKIDNVASSFVISNNGACWIFMSNGTDWFSVAASLDIRLKDQADGNTYKLFMNNGNLQWST